MRIINSFYGVFLGFCKVIIFYAGACFYRQMAIKQGKGSRIYWNVFVKHPENIMIGTNTFINYGSCLWAAPKGRIIIGNDVLFGPNVKIIASNHGTSRENLIRLNKWEDDDIIIEDDVWVGANVVILKGVKVGKGSVIAAGSIVNKNVPSFTIVGGVPAKKLKDRT
jgi:maltose O-acetyltransferase